MSQAKIEHAIMAALRASVGNPKALAALALVELSLGEPPSVRPRLDLHALIDAWGRALNEADPTEIERIKGQLRNIANIAPDDFDIALDFLTRRRTARH